MIYAKKRKLKIFHLNGISANFCCFKPAFARAGNICLLRCRHWGVFSNCLGFHLISLLRPFSMVQPLLPFKWLLRGLIRGWLEASSETLGFTLTACDWTLTRCSSWGLASWRLCPASSWIRSIQPLFILGFLTSSFPLLLVTWELCVLCCSELYSFCRLHIF